MKALAHALSHFKYDFAPGDAATVYLSDRPRKGSHTHRISLWVAGKYRYFPGAPYGLVDDAAIPTYQQSPNGKVIAYAIERAGDGWQRWRFLDVKTGKPLPDEIRGVPDWAPPSWAANGRGFYYGGYASEGARKPGTPIGLGYRSMFHRLHTDQAADRLVYSRPDAPDLLTFAYETADGKYVLAGSLGGATSQTTVVVRKAGMADAFRVLFPTSDANYDYVDNRGSTAYFYTNENASRGRLIAMDLDDPLKTYTVIPERAALLQQVTASGAQFVARYLRDGYNELVVYARTGAFLRTIPLPGRGSATFDGGPPTSRGSFTFSSFTECFDTFAYDTATGRSRKISGFKQMLSDRDYVTDERFAQSTNGVLVPVFIAHRRGLKRDGTTPTILSGYGGFNSVTTPTCYPLSRLWLAAGGVFAWADVRGGGEYGETWHRDGMLANKHHVFDDFAAAARLLIADGYASPATLGAYGYSGGGETVAVTEIEHPALFGAVVDGAGPIDVLRGYSYGSEAYWAGEVGSPMASLEQFHWLAAYAPLLHIRRGTRYPATLILTSQTDTTVSPAHSYKFAAALQDAQSGTAPVLLAVAPAGGHAGNTAYEDWDAAVLATSFLWDNLSRRRSLTASHADSQTLSF